MTICAFCQNLPLFKEAATLDEQLSRAFVVGFVVCAASTTRGRVKLCAEHDRLCRAACKANGMGVLDVQPPTGTN